MQLCGQLLQPLCVVQPLQRTRQKNVPMSECLHARTLCAVATPEEGERYGGTSTKDKDQDEHKDEDEDDADEDAGDAEVAMPAR